MRTPRPTAVRISSRQQKRSDSVAMKPNPPEWRPSDELIQMEAQLFPDGFTLRDEANAIVAMAWGILGKTSVPSQAVTQTAPQPRTSPRVLWNLYISRRYEYAD